MYIYTVDNSDSPLIPINPIDARLLLKQKKAKVINKEPLIIKLNKDTKVNVYASKVILEISIVSSNLFFTVISNRGDIYYNYSTTFNDSASTFKILDFIFNYIYITNVYFSINGSYLYSYNFVNNKEYRNISFKINYEYLLPILSKNECSCEICGDIQTIQKLKAIKIIKNYDFKDNTFFVCFKCLKNLNDFTNKHINNIKNQFDILNILYQLFFDRYIKGENNG